MNALTTKLAKVLMDAYDNGASGFGVRAMTGGVVAEVGDYVDSSYHWVDGEPTDEEIDGTCAYGVDFDAYDDFGDEHADVIAKAVELVESSYGNNDQIVLIAGRINTDEPANDEGEVILKDAQVICIF